MNMRRTFRAFAPLLLTAAAIPSRAADQPVSAPAVAAPASDSAKLQYTLKTGDVFNYKITMHMSGKVHPAAGGQDIPIDGTMQMNQKRAVRKSLPDNGGYEIETTVSDMKINFNGQDMPPSKPIPPITLVINRLGKVREVHGLEALSSGANVPGMDSTTFASIMRDMITFPDKAVKPGDTWTDEAPMPLPGGKSATLSATSKLLSLADGKARIKQDLIVPLDLSLKQPIPMTMKGKQQGTFETVYAQSSGMPMETKGDMNVDVAMAASGLTGDAGAAANMNLSMNLKLNSQLQPALAVADPAKAPR